MTDCFPRKIRHSVEARRHHHVPYVTSLQTAEAMEAEDAEGLPQQTRACSIKLDTRKLSQALHFLNIKYDNAMCCTCMPWRPPPASPSSSAG